ncbi:hypothetical protein FSP39_006564 [Pinctada imbricata]|uniref:Multiple inositol polyphosphate phosphatase 1 n=1 Tax=Pinctada imbricata TaxID=66713 RepID=A0AA88Y598_PINIB|nr:hypothetical protein FSP39_006564 [Pinctada imbricata]
MMAYTLLWQQLVNHRDSASDSYRFLNSWQNKYPIVNESRLTRLGREELYYLGSKYGTELHTLFAVKTGDVNLIASEKIRTQTSAKEFYAGLTASVVGNAMRNKSVEIRNDIVRSYDGCQRYEETVDDNMDLLTEMTTFENGQVYQNMTTDVSTRLGLNKTLGIDEIRVLYELSGIEIGTYNKTDWSTILTDNDREILQYREDLEDYVTRMYGNDLNAAVACPLVKYMITSMNNAMHAKDENRTYTVCDAKFAHSTSMGHFYSAMKLFKDTDPLRADNFESMRSRQFDSSKALPMSTNAAFVVYNCGGDGPDNNVVRLFVNEIETTIPGCENTPCSLSSINSIFKDTMDKCNRQSICSMDTSTANLPRTVVNYILMYLILCISLFTLFS